MTHRNAGRKVIDELFLRLLGLGWIVAGVLSATDPGGTLIALFCFTAAILNLHAISLSKNPASYAAHGRYFSSNLRIFETLGLAFGSAFSLFRSERIWLLVVPVVLADSLVERSIRRSTVMAVAVGLTCGVADGSQTYWSAFSLMPLFFSLLTVLFASVLTYYRENEEHLVSRNQRMNTLMSTASMVAARDIERTLSRALESVVTDLGATAGMITLLSDDDRGVLECVSTFSQQDVSFPRMLEVGDGITGKTVSAGEPIAFESSDLEAIEGLGFTPEAGVSVPIIARASQRTGRTYQESPIGAVTLLFGNRGDAIEPDDLALLRSVSYLLGAAVCNQRMEETQRQIFLRTMESLAGALEARDDYTRGHSHRVCEVSLLIGEELGLSMEELEDLRIGTTLHDIGKIGVPDAILNKPGRLTDEEYEIMRQHPVIGFDICSPLQLSKGILEIIRNHHEKLDGSGYPDGLKGDQLSKTLRIVCVADAFDAMSSPRAYRNVMTLSSVLKELSRWSGVQFDPDVVQALGNLLDSGALDEMYEPFWNTLAEAA
ncbi:MAG TPA: HD domain-containing phosphohydrolase [Fimbriimonas sp.]|nr:HD domain-containing phosphohydrolase [Fimbriimonas sp.]